MGNIKWAVVLWDLCLGGPLGFLTSPTVRGRLSRFILHPDLPLVLVLFPNTFLL